MAGTEQQRAHATREREAEGPDAAVVPARPDGFAQLASAVGNHGFAQLARAGGGLLPSGAVHPAVQSAIDATRGAGSALDGSARQRVGGALGDHLQDVTVHTDSTAAALARSVDARAFTTGSDVYFGAGEYRPGTPDGDALLAHELTHVVQQRGAPTSGPMVVSQPGDAQETEAESIAGELAG